MKTFDRAFGEELVKRLDALPEGAKPLWGELTRGRLIAHLALVLRYTLGEGPELPFKGNGLSRTVFKFLILNGYKEIPHGIRLPRPESIPQDQWFPEGSMDMLLEALEAYFTAGERGERVSRMHPFFGMLNEGEWRKLHYRHFLHHLKQFDIAQGL